MTGLQYVTRAMKKVGAIDPGRVPTSAEADDGLQTLNNLVDSWATQKRLIWSDNIYKQTFPSSKVSYTIGTGGDFNFVRPVDIFWANIVYTQTSPVVRVPLTILKNTSEWLSISVQGISSNIPIRMFYDQGFTSTPGVAPALASAGLGTLYFNPYPSAPLPDLEFSARAQITAFDLTTDYNFPPGYPLAIELSLAEQMFEYAPPEIDRDSISRAAAQARAAIAGPNLEPPRLNTDSGLGRGGSRYFNYLTGNLP